MKHKTENDLCGIYKIINNINGKVYIGQSIKIQSRWKSHIQALKRGDSNCTLLQRAWNKYGEENFSFEILELCHEERLDELETKYIKIYDSQNPNKGYNIESGGNKNKHLAEETKRKLRELHLGKTVSPDILKKMSESRMGSKNPMYGQKHTKETREKMSKSKRGKPGHPCSDYAKERARQANLGKVLSEETKKKISEATQGRVPYNKNLRSVFCIELNKIFANPASAGNELKIRSSNIINCCEHTRKTCGGYHWIYADSDEYAEFIKS